MTKLIDMNVSVTNSEVHDIPIDSIRVGKFILRPIDEEVVEELSQSIDRQGLLEPIMVKPRGEGIRELVFGYHRLQACRKLGWKSIPSRVCELDDAQAFMAAEVENLQRNNFIDPVQEARGFQMLREKGFTESKIGESIGKTQQYVSARSGLLRLEPEIQAWITSRLVTAEHGYELSKIEDSKKRTILAELSRKDREDPINLNELREMAKLTIEELSKDARVDKILLRDPLERMGRIEARVMRLEGELVSLEVNGAFRRDHCGHYNGDTCNWLWYQRVASWNMKQEGEWWKLRVSLDPGHCATCPRYTKKAARPVNQQWRRQQHSWTAIGQFIAILS